MAQAALDKAKEDGDMEEVDKQSRRLVKVTKEHVEEVKVLLGHMGIPWVQVKETMLKTCNDSDGLRSL